MLKPETTGGELNVILNWFEELKRLVPAGRYAFSAWRESGRFSTPALHDTEYGDRLR